MMKGAGNVRLFTALLIAATVCTCCLSSRVVVAEERGEAVTEYPMTGRKTQQPRADDSLLPMEGAPTEDEMDLEAMYEAEAQRQAEKEKVLTKIYEDTRAQTSKKRRAKIIAGVVGGLGALAIALAILWKLKTRRKKSFFEKAKQLEASERA